MDSAFKLNLALIFGLLVGLALCVVATSHAKKLHGLTDVHFGAWPNYQLKDIKALMEGNTATTTNPRAAHFVSPILFPIDLLLLACLGGLAAMGSLLLCEPTQIRAHVTPALLLVLPVLYMACDLTENCLLARMLLLPSKDAVTEGMMTIARAATTLKLLTGGLAGAQVLGLLGWSLCLWFYPRS